MSDLASTSALLKTSPQLPVDWYVDQRAKETHVEDEAICQRMDDGRRHGAFPRIHAPSSGHLDGK